ncbi:testis-expressed protein 47 isoform X3 [Halichoeres trimaculatus]|uniref:testis-expressed protein 47 isoform X3 n=1 Tax=Halichoeres trimaculatus TaxID=147232 RepID=UPI003D9EF528
MASSLKNTKLSPNSWDLRDSDDEENQPMTLFDILKCTMREKIVLQRLIVIARVPHHLADRTEVGAHYERLNFQLSKQYTLDQMTGLLLIYPSCVLYVIELISAAQADGETAANEFEEEEESTETLVCSVLLSLQTLAEQTETSKKAVPGSVLDETPELIISQKLLDKLLVRDELLTPKQYLQLYDSPLHINMDFGQVIRSSCLTTV